MRSTVLAQTELFCPACGGDRAGQVRAGRRWLRVGPLPLVPLASGEPHVWCATCGTEHPLEVLDRLTSSELTALLAQASHQLTVMMVRAGDPADRRLRTGAVHHLRTTIPTYDQNRLDRELPLFDPARAPALVAPLAQELEVEGKERLVVSLVRVALAAHTISAHQRWLIEAVGTTLGLTPLHLTGIVSGVAASVEPPADHP